MEMESRDSGEQLREMAEKVFQLLERLKLAELAKNKAMEVRARKSCLLSAHAFWCHSCAAAYYVSRGIKLRAQRRASLPIGNLYCY